MNKTVLFTGALVGYAAYLIAQNKGQEIDLTAGGSSGFINSISNAAQQTIDTVENLTMGILSLGNMNRAKREMLNIPNVRAMLAVIRKGEGTSDSNGYRRIFGGQLFNSYAAHPNILVSKNGYRSTAAGAYQFLHRVWIETSRIMKLTDFSPANQDLGALGRIAARGALDDVIAGRFEIAIKKLNKEWASLPLSPYGQPVQTMQGAKTIYLANNGTITTA